MARLPETLTLASSGPLRGNDSGTTRGAKAAHFAAAVQGDYPGRPGGSVVIPARDRQAGTSRRQPLTTRIHHSLAVRRRKFLRGSVISAWLQGHTPHAQGFLGSAHKARDLLRSRLWENIGDLSPSLLRCEAVVNDLVDRVRGFQRELYVWRSIAGTETLAGRAWSESRYWRPRAPARARISDVDIATVMNVATASLP